MGKAVSSRKLLATVVLLAAVPAAVHADDVRVETVLSALSSPSGVAIQPRGPAEQYAIFVSDRGAGQIVKIRSDEREKPVVVINRFGQERPAGLFFLDRDHLVVACEKAQADSSVWLYELSDDEPLGAEQTKQAVAIESDAGGGEVNMYSLARTRANDQVPDLLLASSYGEADQPRLWKIRLRAATLADAAAFVDRKQSARPFGIAVSGHGYVVTARPDGEQAPPSSRLVFHNPIDGTALIELAVELEQIVALAYSPQSGNLYAADFGSADDGAHSGVYRIDDASRAGRPDARAVRIADVPRPTALAFGPDGALYVTSAGQSEPLDGAPGLLVKVTGDL